MGMIWYSYLTRTSSQWRGKGGSRNKFRDDGGGGRSGGEREEKAEEGEEGRREMEMEVEMRQKEGEGRGKDGKEEKGEKILSTTKKPF